MGQCSLVVQYRQTTTATTTRERAVAGTLQNRRFPRPLVTVIPVRVIVIPAIVTHMREAGLRAAAAHQTMPLARARATEGLQVRQSPTERGHDLPRIDTTIAAVPVANETGSVNATVVSILLRGEACPRLTHR